jgi:phospholipase C
MAHRDSAEPNQIENPNPQPGTNNWYDQDGYSGGSYSNCADLSQPGVPAVVNYLESLSTVHQPTLHARRLLLAEQLQPRLRRQRRPGNSLRIRIHASAHCAAAHRRRAFDRGPSYTYFGEGWDLYVTDPAGTNPYDATATSATPSNMPATS